MNRVFLKSILKGCVGLLALGLALAALVSYLSLKNGERLLETLRSVKKGDTKEAVRRTVGTREFTMVPANQAGGWLREMFPNESEGEYWYSYFGPYPPRLIIIHFGTDEKVAFVTWTDT